MSIHSQIVSIIETSANAINPTGRFIYGRELNDTLNTIDPATVDPLISLLPFTITRNTSSDVVFNSAAISMVFSQQADVIDDATADEAIMDSMATLAESFIDDLLGADKKVTYFIENVQMQAEYQFWMGTNSGYVLTFTIQVTKPCE